MAGLSNLWLPLSMMRIAPLLKNYMPEIISIDGVIGWDVTAKDIREQLAKAKGSPVEVQISSPGGSVTEGVTIYNLIKSYKGEKTTNIIGLAASMGSYIALAADKVSVADNAVYMIHNAWNFAAGDHHELRKTADRLESVSKNLSKAYVKKTGKAVDEVKDLMDKETWLFGQEIVDAGFADSVEGGEGEEKDEALAFAKLTWDECNVKLKDQDQGTDLEKAAALFRQPSKTPKGAAKMPTLEEILAKNPEAKTEHDKLLAEAKVVEAPKAEPKKEEPKAEAPGDHVAQALNVLKSDAYSASVKDSASKVIEASFNKEGTDYIIAVASFKATVSGYDSAMELAKSQLAAKEQGELKDTPGQQAKDAGVKDGVATSGAGVQAMGEEIKELMNKGAK